MKEVDPFINAYQVFRNSIDSKTEGRLPAVDDLVWCMLAGVPVVPADGDESEDSAIKAVAQRVAILKAVFVETNFEKSDEFLDKGLMVYDEAADAAKRLLKDSKSNKR
jgi:hypothetical protein